MRFYTKSTHKFSAVYGGHLDSLYPLVPQNRADSDMVPVISRPVEIEAPLSLSHLTAADSMTQ